MKYALSSPHPPFLPSSCNPLAPKERGGVVMVEEMVDPPVQDDMQRTTGRRGATTGSSTTCMDTSLGTCRQRPQVRPGWPSQESPREWLLLITLAFTWNRMSSHGQGWTRMNSLGYAWILMDSHRFAWTRMRNNSRTSIWRQLIRPPSPLINITNGQPPVSWSAPYREETHKRLFHAVPIV